MRALRYNGAWPKSFISEEKNFKFYSEFTQEPMFMHLADAFIQRDLQE